MRILSIIIFIPVLSFAADAPAPAEAQPYALTASTVPKEVAVGTAAQYQLSLAPKPGWVLKTVTPFKVGLSGSDGLKLDKTKFASSDFVDPKTDTKVLQTGISALSPGKKTVTADLSFFLCTPELCQRFTDKNVLEINVK